jgi:hypothetical protein
LDFRFSIFDWGWFGDAAAAIEFQHQDTKAARHQEHQGSEEIFAVAIATLSHIGVAGVVGGLCLRW